MVINLKEQYIRHYENSLNTSIWTLQAVQARKETTREDRLRALEAASKQIAEARRALIYLINTEEKGS